MKDKLFALFSKIGVDSVNDLVHVTDQVKHSPFSPPSRTRFTHVHTSLTYFSHILYSGHGLRGFASRVPPKVCPAAREIETD